MNLALRGFFLLPSAFCLLAAWQAPDGSPLPFQTDEEVTAYLREARVVKAGPKKLGGVGGARKVLLENGGIRAHAVFRSLQRVYRNAWWDNGKFTAFLRDSYRNEIAAYELSRLLGLDTVPPTVAWKMRGQAGSLQLWIENGEPGYNPNEARRPPDPYRWQNERDRMRVFDALIENVDRNIGNMLIDPTGKVWWIDHTRSFGRRRDLDEAELIQRCERDFYERLKAADPRLIAERLALYIDKREIEALLERRLKLIALIEERIAQRSEPAVLFTLEAPQ
ncbi:MAG TPA: hypothetical protein VNA04_08005 [Thermoanaerobaculia bacterium]|nr:hypothetical protein [Thermoanaerobaculia bacterium]